MLSTLMLSDTNIPLQRIRISASVSFAVAASVAFVVVDAAILTAISGVKPHGIYSKGKEEKWRRAKNRRIYDEQQRRDIYEHGKVY